MRRGAAVVLLALTLVAAAGCAQGGADETLSVGGEAVPKSRLRDAATALCTARDQAERDMKTARTTFYDRSHDDLHTIARALEGVDRAQTAALLEAKQRVEAHFAADPLPYPPPPNVRDDLDRLAVLTRVSLDRLRIEVPRCP